LSIDTIKKRKKNTPRNTSHSRVTVHQGDFIQVAMIIIIMGIITIMGVTPEAEVVAVGSRKTRLRRFLDI